jgi:hypothetical protein
MSKLAPVLAAVAALGVVGGVAAVQAFQPTEQPQTRVEIVQPAAQVVTPSPTTTAAPSPTATVAPKPVVKVVPKVQSSPKATTDAAPVQEAVVPKSEPAPQTSTSAPAPSTSSSLPKPPPVKWGTDGKPPAPTSTN